MTTWTSDLWATDEFRAELRSFVVEALGPAVELEPVSVQPWSTVWRCRTRSATFYAKQNCPGQAHEARLLSALVRIAPEYVVPVVAADPARDLLLTADVGPTLRDAGRAADVETWCRIVADAANLQRVVLPHVAELPLTVLAPADATTYVADAVGRLAALPSGDPRRLDRPTADRLGALLPDVERWADEVGDLDLPLTLNHNDLHDHNVAGSGTLRFFDFADAVLAEPLAVLLVPLNVCAHALGAGSGDPRMLRVADAALEVWSDLTPIGALRSALPAALRLARLARVESWRRCVATMTPVERGQYGDIPAQWLGMLGDLPPVATTRVIPLGGR